MKRLLIPIIIGAVLFVALAIPKVILGLAYFEEAGWVYAKPVFVRILIDLIFAWVVAVVVWLQLERRPWITTVAFCFSTLLVTAFWLSAFKNAPRGFRQSMAFIYEYIDANPLRALPKVPKDIAQRSEPSPVSLPVAPRQIEETQPEPVVGAEKQVEQTFYTMLRALRKYESGTVLALADQATWSYFSDLKNLALTADREVIEKLKPIDRFQVLALRHIKDRQELTDMTEEGLFKQAVLQGWFFVGYKPEVRIDYIDIMPGGNEAMADIIVNSIIPDERLEFVKEKGLWKMNLLQLLPRQEEKILATLHQKGQSEEEFFWNFLQQETGRAPSPDIWEPVLEIPEQG